VSVLKLAERVVRVPIELRGDVAVKVAVLRQLLLDQLHGARLEEGGGDVEIEMFCRSPPGAGQRSSLVDLGGATVKAVAIGFRFA
jgi:hypothetical protein